MGNRHLTEASELLFNAGLSLRSGIHAEGDGWMIRLTVVGQALSDSPNPKCPLLESASKAIPRFARHYQKCLVLCLATAGQGDTVQLCTCC